MKTMLLMAEAAKDKKNVTLIDWYSRSKGHTEYFAHGIHLENDGVDALTDEILKSIKRNNIGHTEYFAPDGIHLENDGVDTLTDEILKSIKEIIIKEEELYSFGIEFSLLDYHNKMKT